MRTFAEASEEHDLYQWGSSEVGTLYLPRSKQLPKSLVRFFEGDDCERAARSYAGLVEACRFWVMARPKLAAVVEVWPVEEVGRDFVRRRFKPAYVTLETLYLQREPGWEDDHIEPLSSIPDMEAALRSVLDADVSGREAVIQNVMKASLLRGAGKTVEGDNGTWIVVEPSIGPDDLRDWIVADT